MGRPLSKLSERKRAAILKAAAEAFSKDGFHATTMDSVALRAKVSKRTVYNHFPSKDELFDALIDDMWQRLAPAATTMPPASAALAARLKRLANSRLEVLLSDEVIGLFRIIFAESVRSPALVRAYFGYQHRTDFLGVRSLLTEEMKRGRLREAPPDLAAAQFWGLVLGSTFWPLALGLRGAPDATELDNTIGEAVKTFLARFRKRSVV
jgi:TetR/AcrR family transcriptional regulator, regulator of autoinduction and epiphytic fitness